jgi:hypothetical protein
MHRENDDLGIGKLGGDDTGCVNAVQMGHADVHQDYARSVLFDCFDASKTILCLSNDM